jgi:hypothetical protein
MQSYPLDAARADGWFEELGRSTPAFQQLCDVVGDRFLAFSVVAGVQITSITVNPHEEDQSLVEFEFGQPPQAQRLHLVDFRQRVAELLQVPERDVARPELPDAGTAPPEALQAYIGFRYVLLAPLFGVRLEELRVAEAGDDEVVLEDGAGLKTVGLQELREALRGLVGEEGRRAAQTTPFAIDLNVVDRAREAEERGDADAVIDLLGAWPGPLSLLLRTAEGHRLTPEVRGVIAEALGMLGSAYFEGDKADWGLEVLRLGVQWGQERQTESASLFLRMGEVHAGEGRHGEAIGVLRRALSLGAPRSRVLPKLAESFLRRGRPLPALLLLDDCSAEGFDTDPLADLRREAREALGESWEAFRARVPAGRASA